MQPSPNKRYLVGPEQELRDLFPAYAGKDERTLPDGSMLIEVNCTPEQLEVVAACDSIEAFTHPEILDYLRQFEPSESRDGMPSRLPKPSRSKRRSQP